MVAARLGQWLFHTLVCMFFLSIESSNAMELTIVESAVAKGAVCLDGSPPAYHLDNGYGEGAKNWLVFLQGGGWCNSVEDCVNRKTHEKGLGSSKLMKGSDASFSGILSSNYESNPNFHNWNRIYVRYCDGASFTGDVEEVDPATGLHFRGSRIFNAVVEELLAKGMKNAQNVILSGCSAGGLAAILNCDKFREYLPSSARVKCVPDAGFFAHTKDLSGQCHFQEYYNQVVTLHGSAKNLPSACTSKMSPGLCFYPQYVVPYIQTPIFILNSAYDFWQVRNMFAYYEADPSGSFSSCKTDLKDCSTSQLQKLQDFRSDFLGALSAIGNSSTRGMFITSCYVHCQTEYQQIWSGDSTTKLDNKGICEAIVDWFYDKHTFQKIDQENGPPHYCVRTE